MYIDINVSTCNGNVYEVSINSSLPKSSEERLYFIQYYKHCLLQFTNENCLFNVQCEHVWLQLSFYRKF